MKRHVFKKIYEIAVLFFAVAAGLSGQMGYRVSIYTDRVISSDYPTLYGYASASDYSGGCVHTGYQTSFGISPPSGDGIFITQQGLYATTQIGINDAIGTYFLWGGPVQFNCSCNPYGGVSTGSGNTFTAIPFGNMDEFYGYLASVSGVSEDVIRAEIANLRVFNDPNGALISDNLNIDSLGAAAYTNEADYLDSLSQLGFTDATAPSPPIPLFQITVVARRAAAQLAARLGTASSGAVIVLAAVALQDQNAWDKPYRKVLRAIQQRSTDMFTALSASRYSIN